jgi:hypothetical protein
MLIHTHISRMPTASLQLLQPCNHRRSQPDATMSSRARSLPAWPVAAFLSALSGAVAPAPLQCGVASAVFSTCPACLRTALSRPGLKFWWSWGIEPELDSQALGPDLTAAARQLFVPMLWGQGNPPTYDFLSGGSTHVMGFNEPDQSGPSCDGDWHPPAYGCADGEWRAATSSGWAPLL